MKKCPFKSNNYPDCLDQREYLCLILLIGVCVGVRTCEYRGVCWFSQNAAGQTIYTELTQGARLQVLYYDVFRGSRQVPTVFCAVGHQYSVGKPIAVLLRTGPVQPHSRNIQDVLSHIGNRKWLWETNIQLTVAQM